MGRKEFNEKLEELNLIRQSLLKDDLPLKKPKKDQNDLARVEMELNHLKLLHHV